MLFPCRPAWRVVRACALVLLLGPSLLHAQPSITASAGDALRLSPGDAVSVAMRQSYEVGITAAQVDVADAVYGGARASLLPQLRLSTSYLHLILATLFGAFLQPLAIMLALPPASSASQLRCW